MDPLLPEVAWSWLTESLDASGAGYSALGGTVTATSSTRFGDIAGPQRADDLEMRASWTADERTDLHLQAFAGFCAVAAGLPPEGVTLHPRARSVRSHGETDRTKWTGRFGCLTTDGRRADTNCDNGTTVLPSSLPAPMIRRSLHSENGDAGHRLGRLEDVR